MDPRLIFEVITSAVSVLVGYIALSVQAGNAAIRLEIANLRTKMAENYAKDLERRAAERAELMKWINGSFMRATVVEARLIEIERRIQNVEDIAA